jgi:hypothetical protein
MDVFDLDHALVSDYERSLGHFACEGCLSGGTFVRGSAVKPTRPLAV